MNYLSRVCKKPPLGMLAAVLAIAGLTALFLGSRVNSQEAQPGAADGAQAASAKAVLRSYPCALGTAEATASRLEQQYPPSGPVRIVADSRASQVLVIAPPDIQTQIEGQLKQTSPPAATPAAQPRQASSSAASAPPATLDLQLNNTSGRDLEAALLRTLAERLSPVSSQTPESSSYRLVLPGGEQLLITLDRQTNHVKLQGANSAVSSAARLIQVLDHRSQAGQGEVGLCSLNKASRADVAMVASALQANSQAAGPTVPPEAPNAPAHPPTPPADGQPKGPAPKPAPGPATGPETTQIVPLPGAPATVPPNESEGLIGPVQIQILDGLDVLVVRGHQRDVQRVMEIIRQIEQLSTETKPEIRILTLKQVDSVALAALLRQVYAEAFAARLGTLSITALGRPNSILFIGREETVQMAVELAGRLDQPVAPNSQFQVFRLKTIAAEEAQQTVQTFFSQQQTPTVGQQARTPQQQAQTEVGALTPRVQVVADFRSNSLIVQASPRELAQVAALIQRIDSSDNAALNQVRVFRLKNSLAETLAPVLQDAITGQIYGQKTNRGQFAMARATGQTRQDFERKSSRLQFIAINAGAQQAINSGILTDAQVTADARTNSIVVTASADSMPLIAALIEELDQPPNIEAQVKVFTLANSDASAMMEMLQQIFGQTNAAEGIAVQTGTTADQNSLVGLKVAVDVRTNSVIATGSVSALTVVEAVLIRLDGRDFRNRQTTVYRLRNVNAEDAATAINQYLTNVRQVSQMEPGLLSPSELIEREVVVVPERVSNSLIISATPRFYDEIMKVINDIDMRPPMVMIQVLIAEVSLDDTDEFGVELGLQDKVLFDRSNVIGSGENATLVPGFQFNSQNMGNSARSSSVATAGTVGGQSITNLGVGRTDSNLGFGGLVLSASSESVSLLIRALEQQHRLQVLSRPQIMTTDNQPGEVLVGQQVPTITASQLTQFGVVNSVTYTPVGLSLTVTPRVSPDRLIVMDIQAIKSKLEPISQGIPIAISNTGEPIRSPIIDTTSTHTIVSAVDGQTIVLAGMIATSSDNLQNKVPYLAEIPVLGHLFQYTAVQKSRSELLIIMTPRVVTNPQDADSIRRVEAARMHWCLCDVMALQDGDGLGQRGPSWYDGDAAVVYPDLDPTLRTMQELVPPEDGTSTTPPEVITTPQASPPQAPPAPYRNSQPAAAPPPAAGATTSPKNASRIATNVQIVPPAPAPPAQPTPVPDNSQQTGYVQSPTITYQVSPSPTANR